MTRFARSMPVLYIEEAVFEGRKPPYLASHALGENSRPSLSRICLKTCPWQLRLQNSGG